ncbi:MAG: hypothetical protein CSA19_00175 [Deltaproteobacteria bacterium]|nr:MAG: hypothetical protein CSA19_00175 [Deltaproteobacteria bacterium]
MVTSQSFVDTPDSLPSPPIIAMRILEAVKDDSNSFEDLAKIVKTDPALTTKILKIANSSLYGLPKNVDSLSQATSLIGLKALKNIALSFVIVNSLDKEIEGAFDISDFWKRSITTGVAAELIGSQLNHQTGDLFVSGLLQNIGVLILFSTRPLEAQRVLDEKRVSGKPLYQVEEEILGFNHAEIGAELLELWNIPQSIYQPIRHHLSESFDEKYKKESLILKISNRIAAVYYGSRVSETIKEVHKLLTATAQIPKQTIDELIDQVGAKSREMMNLFLIDSKGMQPISVIIQRSNDELKKLNLSYEQVVYDLKKSTQKAEKLAKELKQANEKLSQLAYFDELTGLYNFRYFQETLDDEIYRANRYQQTLSVMLIDIDFFKKVNDTYGHLIGDLVLKNVGKELVQLVRQSDVVARYGGEEFAIILPSTGITGAKVIGQRVRRGIERLEIKHEQINVSITVSVGISSTEMENADNKKTLLSYSDEALYQAKRNGRNRLEMLENISMLKTEES